MIKPTFTAKLGPGDDWILDLFTELLNQFVFLIIYNGVTVKPRLSKLPK